MLTRGVPAAAGLSRRCHDGDSLRLAVPGRGAGPPVAALSARGRAAGLCPGMHLRLRLLLLAPVLLVRVRLLLLLARLRRPAGGGAACLGGLQAQAAHLCLRMQTWRHLDNPKLSLPGCYVPGVTC